MKTITTNSPEETIETASRIARELSDGDFVALIGDLGAGKTVFVKGLAKGAGIEEYLYVNSPSFVLLKEYHGARNLYHFDAYRLDQESFSETLDYRRYFYGEGLVVVEWADRIQDLLPEERLEVRITHVGENVRKIQFRGVGSRFEKIIKK